MIKKKALLVVTLLLLTISLIGCLKEDTVKGEIKGTIEEKYPQQNMILVLDNSNTRNKIPVDDIEKYEIGDKVEITVYMDPEKNGATTYENSKFVIKK
ncbi:hypothetical protein N780_15775 [Pontibacillus chungwhensis BH030062]|uniref:DUF3221 domain-containing protein n=1 Tax=Pontibacillus chungwhensis BH030062 TaxID=1385513 RepID=A0A0A2UUN1_9BACI|nr:hypothetical protein [Pontibacillus chungwhensis]KGP92002.1 hypothetical protein N780_15775 [Pontibacillus chungwhensis BH030062]